MGAKAKRDEDWCRRRSWLTVPKAASAVEPRERRGELERDDAREDGGGGVGRDR